ncbi:MAG: glycosyltransferase [bacterium]|nr:glycosyltransferase [bacterium]
MYVGAVKETKGITVLIEACRILKERGLEFELKVVGQFESDEYRETVTAKVKEYELESRIAFDGVLTGGKKFQRFANADIFCYPTYFESETFGIVLLEAMQFALPVVATRWRGVQSVVSDGETGYLTPIKDSTAFADKLQTLLENPDLRNKMKKKSKETFKKKYTIKEFHKNMEKVFLETGN